LTVEKNLDYNQRRTGSTRPKNLRRKASEEGWQEKGAGSTEKEEAAQMRKVKLFLRRKKCCEAQELEKGTGRGVPKEVSVRTTGTMVNKCVLEKRNTSQAKFSQ